MAQKSIIIYTFSYHTEDTKNKRHSILSIKRGFHYMNMILGLIIGVLSFVNVAVYEGSKEKANRGFHFIMLGIGGMGLLTTFYVLVEAFQLLAFVSTRY